MPGCPSPRSLVDSRSPNKRLIMRLCSCHIFPWLDFSVTLRWSCGHSMWNKSPGYSHQLLLWISAIYWVIYKYLLCCFYSVCSLKQSVPALGEACHSTQVPTFIVQFSSVAQSCPTPCDPMNRSTPGLPVHHQLLEFTQTHVHWVGDAIQPSHPLSSPSPPAFNLSQHQGHFKWVSSSHQVVKVLEFQLQHQA